MPKRKTAGTAEGRRREQPCNDQPTKPNKGIRVTKPNPDGGAVASPTTEPPSVSDMVIEDLTPNFSQSERFEEQLRELDQAINAVDILKGDDKELSKRQTQSMGSKEFSTTSANTQPSKQGPQTGEIAHANKKMGSSLNGPYVYSKKVSANTSAAQSNKPVTGNGNVMGTDYSAQVSNKNPTKEAIVLGHYQSKENSSVGGVGKENISPGRASEIHTTGTQNNENLGTWKRIPRGGVQGEGEIKDPAEIGAKRKKSRLLQELDKNVVSEKRSKFEGKVVEMGQLMAKHMGSAEAAGQPCRNQ
nr:hypothetical protein CFP56_10745 [Quercus suber]